jgi:hypothetical protein
VQRFREVPGKLRAAVDAILSEHAALQQGAQPRREPASCERHHQQQPQQQAGAAGGDHGPNGSAAAAHAGAAGAPPAGCVGVEGGGADAATGGLVAALHLGDIIDGYPSGSLGAAARAHADLDLVLLELGRLSAAGVPLRHVFGNHCFAVPRSSLLRTMGFPRGSRGWYAAELAPGWRLLVVDTTDVSLFGHEEVLWGEGARGARGKGARRGQQCSALLGVPPMALAIRLRRAAAVCCCSS